MKPLHTPDHDHSPREWVSALCDGRLDGQSLDRLLEQQGDSAELHATWHGYQVIGDVLRGQYAGPGLQSPSAFLSTLHARLAAPDVASLADAATVPVEVGVAAANDPVFRWKLASGFASVVAVVAIGWNLLAVSPDAAAPASRLAVQATPAATQTLASAQAGAAATPAAAQPAASRTVVVATPQGRVIRDASLERLLAEHRQHGGMSAFQTSTGFIRNATYDADAR